MTSMIPQVVPGMTKECGPEFWGAVFNAQKEARALVKKNPGQPNKKSPQDFAVGINKDTGQIQYDYRPMWWFSSIEDFLEEQRRVCFLHGLVVIQGGKLGNPDPQFGRITGLACGFLVVHAPTGQGGWIPFEVPIKTSDKADRDAQNAYNWAESYFLRSFLRIRRLDDKSQQKDVLGVAHEHVDLTEWLSDGSGAAEQPAQGGQQQETNWLTLDGGVPALCSACEQQSGQLNQQFMTQGGPSCANGHGGAAPVPPPEHRQQNLPFQQGGGQAPAQHGSPGGGAGQPQQQIAGPVHGQSGSHGVTEAAPPQQQQQLPQHAAPPHGGHGAPAQAAPGPGPAPEPSPGTNVVNYAQQALDSSLITEQQMAQERAPRAAEDQQDWPALLMQRGCDEATALQLASVDPDAEIPDVLKVKVTQWAIQHFNGDKAQVVGAWSGTGFVPQTGLPAGARRANPTGLAMLKYLTQKITFPAAVSA